MHRGYIPIRDYGLIGDMQSAALVARDGSIDWCCLPNFDSPAVFCRLLDSNKGGWFRVGPTGPCNIERSYIDRTNVLATSFTSDSGQVRVTDLMPIQQSDSHSSFRHGATTPPPRILRLLEGVAGEIELEISVRPTFDFARGQTVVSAVENGAFAKAGAEVIAVECPIRLVPDTTGVLRGRMPLKKGSRFWITLTYHIGDPRDAPTSRTPAEADAELDRTLDYWRDWSGACAYHGPYEKSVLRSALTLKLLSFSRTGAFVAAPTTSLPEEISGVRNWDYRYTWMRDTALTLYALMALGYHREATDFWEWLEALCRCCPGDLQSVYTLRGHPDLPEIELPHLEGYRGSGPVRIGNAAARQVQLDVYGQILDAADFCFRHMPRRMDPKLWSILSFMADRAAGHWRQPDQGPWEIRAAPRHFLYSKLFCWTALDRAIRLAEDMALTGNLDNWRMARKEIREAILAHGYDGSIGAFTQALGEPALDASVLSIPLVGFLPATDPRVLSTIDRIREKLMKHGLVSRYTTDDGLPGGDATFTACSFWMVDNLALAGRIDEARELFEHVIDYSNDLGLFAEEIDPDSGGLLGNFPQGFTHLALIRAAVHIAKAETLGAEREARTAAERATELRQV